MILFNREGREEREAYRNWDYEGPRAAEQQAKEPFRSKTSNVQRRTSNAQWKAQVGGGLDRGTPRAQKSARLAFILKLSKAREDIQGRSSLGSRVEGVRSGWWACLLVVLLLLGGPGPVLARDFDPRRDGFAFANETSFAYGVDEAGRLHMESKANPPAFAHRCLCMVRGAMQFWKFARFEPKGARVSAGEYRSRVRAIFRVSAWMPERAEAKRIVIPGYANLWEFSKAQQRLVQEEIGNWLPTYLRVGNWRMPFPPFLLWQGVAARKVERSLAKGPQAVFLTKYPSMNHAVLAYAAEPLKDGSIRFRVYDPNYPGQSARLDYVAKRGLFDFEKRFYWPGGEVRAFRIYLSPVH